MLRGEEQGAWASSANSKSPCTYFRNQGTIKQGYEGTRACAEGQEEEQSVVPLLAHTCMLIAFGKVALSVCVERHPGWQDTVGRGRHQSLSVPMSLNNAHGHAGTRHSNDSAHGHAPTPGTHTCPHLPNFPTPTWHRLVGLKQQLHQVSHISPHLPYFPTPTWHRLVGLGQQLHQATRQGGVGVGEEGSGQTL